HGFHLYLSFFIVMIRLPPISTLFPYTTLFRSNKQNEAHWFFHSHCCSPLNIHLSIFNMKITAILVAFTLFVIPGMAQYSPDKARSEEHTSELQSRENLVCRLLLEKKKKKIYYA